MTDRIALAREIAARTEYRWKSIREEAIVVG